MAKKIRLKIYGHEKDFPPNHSIEAMSEALGGEQKIKSTWE